MMVSVSSDGADTLIIGDGIIGLSIAHALATSGGSCRVIGRESPGMASRAAAGLLMPSLASLPAGAQEFFAASLDAYPAFVDRLRPFDAALSIVEGLYDLSTAAGPQGRFYPRDGSIDNARLVAALEAAVSSAGIPIERDDPVVSLDLGGSRPSATTSAGRRLTAGRLVVAAGAWAPQIAGLPRPLPVRPLKGQMLALASSAIDHPTVGDDVYLVPRPGEVLVGATVEEAGFDTVVHAEAIEELRRAAVRLIPALADAPAIRSWAGSRPATPDMLPIVGRDPEIPGLIYACGHSKNGILLAPATAAAVAAIVRGDAPPVSIDAFSIERFG